MSYFYLPKIYPNVSSDNIKFSFIEKKEYQENSNEYLDNLLDDVEKYKNNTIIKNILSPLFLLTNNVMKKKKASIEYLKFIEIFNLTKIVFSKTINALHFEKNSCDSVKALIELRKNKEDKHYIVGRKKKEEENNLQILFNDKIKNNLLDASVFNNLKTKFVNSFDFITVLQCDLTDDNGNNLIILYVLLSLLILNDDASFIFRIPNLNDKLYVEILFFLSNYFDRLIVIKPNMTCYFENEKYICCKNMGQIDKDFISSLCDSFLQLYKSNKSNIILSSFIDINIPITFFSKIDECNSITMQSQLENLCYLNNICKMCDNKIGNNKISEINERNKQKCINWCISNGIEYNE